MAEARAFFSLFQRVLSVMETSQNLNLFRRWLLGCGLLVVCGVVASKIAGMSLAFLKPPQKKDSFGSLINAGPLSALAEPGASPKLVPQGRFWLVHNDAGLHAVYNCCTHLRCLFGWDEEKQLFICPCHGSEFSRDGKVLKGPATRDLDRFPVQLVDDRGTTIRRSEGQAPMPIADMLRGEEGEGQGVREPAPARILAIQVDTGRRIAGQERTS